MGIWKYKTDIEKYRDLGFVNRADSKLFVSNFRGKPFPQPWPSIPVYYDKEWEDPNISKAQRKFSARYKDLPKGDFPSLPGSVPVFSERALQVLEPLIRGSVELIPLVCQEDKLYLINVIDSLDCFDRQRSVLKELPGGAFMGVDHYEIKNAQLFEGKGIVRFSGLPVDIFVTDAFRKLVEEHDLKGLLWQPLP